MAFELHKFPWEVEELPCDEYDRIITYMKWRNDQEKAAQKKANKKGGRK